MADMAIFQVQGPDSVMQSGASPGSSVGDTNGLVLMVYFDCFLSLAQVCYLTPGPKHSKIPFLEPKYHFLANKR